MRTALHERTRLQPSGKSGIGESPGIACQEPDPRAGYARGHDSPAKLAVAAHAAVTRRASRRPELPAAARDVVFSGVLGGGRPEPFEEPP